MSNVPPWLAELRRRKGLHEVYHKKSLWDWLKSDGKTLGDPSKLPWCGDAIETCIHLTLKDEPRIANPYLARNWLKFGIPCSPRLGAVMVFWRGSRNVTSGHVALYEGEDANYYHVIGGNQSDSITVTRIAKSRFLGARWPKTYPLTGSAVAKDAVGKVSTNEA